jgi:hypothetical protein
MDIRIGKTTALVAVAALVAAALLAGRGVEWLEAQGRTGPQPRTGTEPSADPVVVSSGREVLLYGEDGGAPGQANGFIAVTGSYGVGTSVLYLIDTVNRQLAVYEARGGSRSMRRVVLVGARRIDLDLQLEGYNDESEYSYAALLRRFEESAAGQPPRDETGRNTQGR